MESLDITRLIQNELLELSRPIRSCVNLNRCLVTPIRTTFLCPKDGEPIDLWLVLEEQPETKSGYKIVFDEKTKEFGLATGEKNIFIGIYGSFIETLEGM